MNVDAKSGAKEISFSAIVTRADGTVEDLGVISYYNNNPIKQLIWKLKKFLKIG
jgi:hypothetical protein